MSPWKTLPAHAADAQVFAIGDVHGQADTLAATLDAIASVPRSHLVRRLIFLGDLIDRGPQSLTAISLYESAGDLAMVDDVILLPGNHELLLLDGIDIVVPKGSYIPLERVCNQGLSNRRSNPTSVCAARSYMAR
jgi:serine/threonine protein phosphatase 1